MQVSLNILLKKSLQASNISGDTPKRFKHYKFSVSCPQKIPFIQFYQEIIIYISQSLHVKYYPLQRH